MDPAKTLLYLNQWRRDPFDVNFPDYTAKPEFGRFVEAAHQHGFRVMPHVNLIGVNADHPLYAEVQKFQYRNPWTGNLMGWFWDRTDIPRNRIAAINPASAEFRKYFVQQLKEVWQKYGVDAFFLDVSARVENDANGLIEGVNAGQGNVLLHKELAAAMPGVVFGGESLHEVTFSRESFAQRWKTRHNGTPRDGAPRIRLVRFYFRLIQCLTAIWDCLILIAVYTFTKSIWTRMRFGAFCPHFGSRQYLTWSLNG